MNQLKLTSFFICLFIMGLVIAGNSQTVKQDASGNYVPAQSVRDSTGAKKTGNHYTDSKGNVFDVWESKKGKKFVIRISKNTGLPYNSYLKIQK